MSLGQLCAAVPDEGLGDDHRWRQALFVVPDQPGRRRIFAWDRVTATVSGFDEWTAEGVRKQLRHYPTARDVSLVQLLSIPPGDAVGPDPYASAPGPYGAQLCWPTPTEDLDGQERALDAVAPRDIVTELRRLRPGIGGAALSDLKWALLFALSMLARYEPASWTAALDYDNSPLAVPLAVLLDTATEAVPALVLDALDPLRHFGASLCDSYGTWRSWGGPSGKTRRLHCTDGAFQPQGQRRRRNHPRVRRR